MQAGRRAPGLHQGIYGSGLTADYSSTKRITP
jgi:hypothetical protein